MMMKYKSMHNIQRMEKLCCINVVRRITKE